LASDFNTNKGMNFSVKQISLVWSCKPRDRRFSISSVQ